MTTITTPTFRELGIPKKLIAKLDQLGLTTPFPIQAATIGDALAGRDVLGKAPTGSGKTLAFSLPLAMLAAKAQPKRPTALVLVPTRELATQVRQTLEPFAQRCDRRVVTVFGGTPLGKDISRLRGGVDILVACPGRLADLIRRDALVLDDVSFVVLDEADRMADMGFLPEVTRLLDQTRKDRQTLLFSATLDGAVDTLIQRYQRNPVRHEVATPEEDRGDVRHLFFGVERHDRRAVTEQVLANMSPAIVFTRTKHGADRLAKQLQRAGISTAAIHGDRSQRQRERALAQFSAGSVTTLVATDVAARGIHIDDVAVVVHYDLPNDPKDFVHRSGRTGRAGADGVVVAYAGHEEAKALDLLQRTLDMPRGLHATQMDLLTADAASQPTIATEHSARQSHQGPTKNSRRRPQNGRKRNRPNGKSEANRGAGNGSSGQRNARPAQGTASSDKARSGTRSRTNGSSSPHNRNGQTSRPRGKASRGRPSHTR